MTEATTRGKYVESPRIAVQLDHNGVTGPLNLTFASGARCLASGGGYLNTGAPRVTYRGNGYQVHLIVRRLSDGPVITWGYDPDDRRTETLDVPKTYRGPIMAAILDAVEREGTQEVIDRATYADAMRDLRDADMEVTEADIALRAARDKQRALRGTVAAVLARRPDVAQ